MPRTVWSGAISFGLVTVPINVQSATEDHSVRFHQYHLEDMGRVRVRKYCEVEDREVTSGEIGKGYQLTKDQVIPISDDELRDLPLPTAVELSDEEIDGALALMDTMTREDLDAPEFRDTYTEALEQIIEAKREHREPPALPEPERQPGQVVDLMAALQESVQKARTSRGEDAEVHEMPKKKTAKKQPAKKTAAKKTAGRKPRSA